MNAPPDVLRDHDRLPWRIAQQAVEARTFAQEDLWKRSREVQRHQRAHCVGHGTGLAQSEQHFLIEVLRQVTRPGSMSRDHIERGPGSRDGRRHVGVQGAGFLDFPLGSVGDERPSP